MRGIRSAYGGTFSREATGFSLEATPPPGALPGFEFIPSPYHSDRGGSPVLAIIYHFTAGPRLEGTVQWFKKNPKSVSAHFVIGKDGRVVQMVGLDRAAHHAGQGALPGVSAGVNSASVGIEIVNWGQLEQHGGQLYTFKKKHLYTGTTPVRANDRRNQPHYWEPYTDAQYEALIRLTRAILERAPMVRWITGHEDVARPYGRKNDPGGAFDWARVRAALAPVFSGHIGPLPPPAAGGGGGGRGSSDATRPSAPAGSSGAAMTEALRKAVAANRRYAEQLGWAPYRSQIAYLVGFTDMSPDDAAFAEGVAAWQAANGLGADGAIGPKTWAVLQRVLGVGPASGPPGAPARASTPAPARPPSSSPSSRNTGGLEALARKIEVYAPLIDAAAREFGVDPVLIRGVIAGESGGDPNKRSATNYQGLMQAARPQDKKGNQFDPATSIRTGAEKLALFTARLNEVLAPYRLTMRSLPPDHANMMLVLSYNAGPGTIRHALRYAAADGDPRKWFAPEHYRRALLFSGGYGIKSADEKCFPSGDRNAAIAQAERQRLEWKARKNDPGAWDIEAPGLLPLVRCAIETKHNRSPGYWRRIRDYMQYVTNRGR